MAGSDSGISHSSPSEYSDLGKIRKRSNEKMGDYLAIITEKRERREPMV